MIFQDGHPSHYGNDFVSWTADQWLYCFNMIWFFQYGSQHHYANLVFVCKPFVQERSCLLPLHVYFKFILLQIHINKSPDLKKKCFCVICHSFVLDLFCQYVIPLFQGHTPLATCIWLKLLATTQGPKRTIISMPLFSVREHRDAVITRWLPFFPTE